MKVEIWSDIACPFCYIGKKNFETAIEQFSNKKNIEVEWKSYQLDPSISDTVAESQENYLVKRKRMSREQVCKMLDNVTEMAKQAGLEYHLDKTITINTKKAHQLIQFAKSKKHGDKMEERLFYAYFTEGRNIADSNILAQLGLEIGLNEKEVQAALIDDTYLYQMKQDIQEAEDIGVRGVPFFVFDRKYAISGAQPPQAFLETLNKSFAEWKKANPEALLEVKEGKSCSTNGTCD